MNPYPDIPVTRDVSGSVDIAYFAEVQRRASEEASVGGEVRLVARMDTDAQRTVYLEAVREERGREAAHELRLKVWRYMQANRITHDEPQQEGLFA